MLSPPGINPYHPWTRRSIQCTLRSGTPQWFVEYVVLIIWSTRVVLTVRRPAPSVDSRDHTSRSVCCAHSTTRAGRDREYVESQHFSFLLDSDNPASLGITTLVFCSNLTSDLAWRRLAGYSVLGHAPRPQFARLICTVDGECTQQC